MLAPAGFLLGAGSDPGPAGQERTLSFRNISVVHGLPNGTVNAVACDSAGYVWFGTLDGLCRYNGYDVEVFRHDPLDSTSVSDNAISVGAMMVDHAGRLWIGTYTGGLDRFDAETGRFVHFRHDSTNPRSLSDDNVRALYEDSSGTLWVGTFGGGLDRLTSDEGVFDHFRHDSTDPNSLGDDFVRCITGDRSGGLWIGTKNGGVTRFNRAGNTFARLQNRPDDPGTIPAGEVWSVCEDAFSHIWIGTDHGLCRFDPETGSITRFTHTDADRRSLSNNFVIAIREAAPGHLWIGTYGGGINRYVDGSAGFTHVRHGSADASSLSSDLVRSMCIGRTSSGSKGRPFLWVGTDGTGVDRENTERKPFGLFRNDPADVRSLPAGIVYAFCEDASGSLWVGTSTGLCRLDSVVEGKGRFTRYRHSAAGRTSLGNDFVTALLRDSVDRIWIGTWGGGIDLLDKERRSFIHFREGIGPSGGLSSNSINALYEDRSGNIWAGTSTGLDLFNPVSGSFEPAGYRPGRPRNPVADQIRAILQDHDGAIWVGTDGGLMRLDRASRILADYTPRTAGSRREERVYALLEDHDGAVWIGTSNGLERMNPGRDSLFRFDAQTGLPSTYIRGIVADEEGDLWLSTTKGLTRYDPRTGRFRHYDASDGLEGNEFSGAAYRDFRGEILIGGLSGFNTFQPRTIIDNMHVPPIVLTGFSIFEKPAILDRPIDVIRTISLNYNEDFFSFAFAALDFTDPVKNTYAYKLDGFDKEWVNAGTRRHAYYTNVGPGEYTFRVKGANNDGIWNETGTSVKIIVSPPYWETIWFRALVVAGLIGILTVLYNYRVSKLLEIERMRVRISSDLHDDIGSSLSSIALLTDLVGNRLPTGGRERQQLSDVSRVARGTADALKDIVWVISPEHDKLDDIILRMKDGAARLLVGIDYSFHCPDAAMTSILDMEFRRNVLLMYKEALNNVAKYSRATKVDISVSDEGQVFSMKIADNGVGFDEATVQKGNGLRNLRTRAEKLGGTITIASRPGSGTTVEFHTRIP